MPERWDFFVYRDKENPLLVFLFQRDCAKRRARVDNNKRVMKPTDFEFFLIKFRQELGVEKFKNYLKSVSDSIPYWRSNVPTFAESMETLLVKLK